MGRETFQVYYRKIVNAKLMELSTEHHSAAMTGLLVDNVFYNIGESLKARIVKETEALRTLAQAQIRKFAEPVKDKLSGDVTHYILSAKDIEKILMKGGAHGRKTRGKEARSSG